MDSVILLIVFLISIGLTLAGLVSRFKLFLLLAIGGILVMAYEFATAEFAGNMVLATCLVGWLIFNIYVAFAGMTAHE